MKKMNETGLQSLMVCGEYIRLLGTISDGDIRKALVQGRLMDDPVSDIMNTNPTTINSSTTRAEILSIFIRHQFKLIPIVSKGIVTGCEFISDFIGLPQQMAPMLIMAGGFGKRLGELTKSMPKPMLEVSGKPIIRHIVDRAIVFGVTRIFISVHYLADQIKDYLGDGSLLGISIEYIEEVSPLGTAGSFQKLPAELKGPVLVSNADIISKIDYTKLIQHHLSNDASATMAVRENTIQNPFGVVLTDGIFITGFDEKPAWRTRINAGIYVLDASLKNRIDEGEHIDMPELILRQKSKGGKVIIFQLEDDWFDIGNPEEYNKLV